MKNFLVIFWLCLSIFLCLYLPLSSFFFDCEIAGDKSSLHICPDVEKHLSDSQRYRVSWKKPVGIYTNLQILFSSASSAPAECIEILGDEIMLLKRAVSARAVITPF